MKKKANEKTGEVSRRDFIKASAAVSLAAMGVGTNRIYAAGSGKIRVGLIGCGGRGNGALSNCLSAGEHIGREMEVVATADWFKDRAVGAGKKHEVPEERCFYGADAYKKLLKTNVDVVCIATSPNFRPVHFEAAVKAGKHVFMEKPVAVDPPGGRKIIEAGELAKEKGLGVVAGTQRRHQRGYRRNAYAIKHGAIGKILGGCVWWCGGALWYRRQNENESDADYLVRNWVSFAGMSGDHIVEQHVHNIDVINWFSESRPVKAVAFGSRQRRVTGDQYDFFSTDFEYENGIHVHSMCRQINGCINNVSEYIRGTEGYSNCCNTIYNPDGSVKWQYNYPKDDQGQPTDSVKVSPYDQEHIDLVTAIRENKPYTEAENTAISTMSAIMGRISAYTGSEVSWEELMGSSLKLGPAVYQWGPVDIDKTVPVPGSE